jgi:hypothetical protein
MTDLSPEKLREAHLVTAEMQYELQPVMRGYANRTLVYQPVRSYHPQ